MQTTTVTGEYVTIAEAAERLGISKSAVRRRLAGGQLLGRREERPQGHVWLIELAAGPAAGHPNGIANGVAHHPENGAARTDTSRDVPAGVDTSRQVPREVPAGAAGGAAAMPGGGALQRAQEMAVYSEQLLRPYVAKIESQATQIGRLEGEVEHLRAQLDVVRASDQAEAPQTPNEAPQGEPWPEARSWWQKLLWG